MAESLFKTSDLYLKSAEKKKLAAKWMENELAQISENVIFTEPFKDNPNNRWSSPYLDDEVANIRKNQQLIAHVMELKEKFQTQNQALLHGDLHTGSVMVTEQDTKVIDPEFSMFGPMGFDIGAFVANLFLSYFSQEGHARSEADDKKRKEYKRWLLLTIDNTWSKFSTKFKRLWNEHHKGEGYELLKGAALGEVQSSYLMKVFQDAIGFAGVKMIRRLIGIAHVEDFESISDPQLRAHHELKALRFAQQLILKRGEYTSMPYIFFEHHLQEDR
jgi:5-methylthioribose kinase